MDGPHLFKQTITSDGHDQIVLRLRICQDMHAMALLVTSRLGIGVLEASKGSCTISLSLSLSLSLYCLLQDAAQNNWRQH